MVTNPTPEAKTGPLSRVRAALATFIVASLVAFGLAVYAAPAEQARADTPTGCNYGDPGESYERATCWFEFTGYDPAQAGSAAGQQYTVYIGGGLTASYTLRTTGSLTARDTPTYEGAYFDRLGYTGLEGLTSLLSNGSATVTISDLVVRNAAGTALTGYRLVGADAEDSGINESMGFTSDVPLTQLHALGNACAAEFSGNGTNSVMCRGADVGNKTGMAMLGADNGTTMTVAIGTQSAWSGVAFGIMTAKVTLNKTITPERYTATDQFELNIAYPNGTPAGAPGATSGTGLTATTTEMAVVTGPAAEIFTLSETATSGSLANYTQSWSCTRNGQPLEVTGTTSVQVPVALGDDVQCTVTNTKVADPSNVTGGANQGQPATFAPDLPPNIDPATVRLLDPDGNPVTNLVVDGEGTWATAPDGSITFTPEDGFQGDPAPVQYTGTAADGTQAPPATLTLDYPDASDVTGVGAAGAPVTVQPVIDEDSVASSVRLLDSTGAPVTELAVPNEGTWTVNPTTGAMTFTPEDGFTGDPTPVQYQVSDANGFVSEPAPVTITTAGVTVPPVTAAEGKPATITPQLDEGLDPASVVVVGPDGNPTKELVVPNEGTWTANPDGTVTFTPVAGFTGDPTPVGVTAALPDGTLAEPAPVNLTYAGISFGETTAAAAQGAPVTFTPTLEPGLDPSTVVLLDPDGNPVKELVVPGEGTWTVNPDGSTTFVPLPTFEGDPTPVQVTAADAAGTLAAPSTLTINYPDVSDTRAAGVAGEPVTVAPILDEDTDPTTVRLLDAAGNPATSVVRPGEGTWSVNPTTGEITFTPEPNFRGNPAPIQFAAADAAGNLARPATLTVTAPGVAPVEAAGPQGQPVTIPTQLDEGLDPTTVALLDPAGNRVKQLVVPGEGTWTVDPVSGAVTFAPDPTFQGDPTPVQVTAQLPGGQFSAPATFAINYPDAGDITATAAQGQPAVIAPVLDEDADPTSVRLLDAAGNPVTERVVPGEGTWTVDPATGRITFTPEANFTGDPTPVQYRASDAAGNPSLPATITLTTAGLGNNPPASGAQGEPVTITPALEPGIDPTTVALIDPVSGQRVKTLTVPGEGLWQVDPVTGAITFTPGEGFEGDPTPVQFTAATTDGTFAEPSTAVINYPDVGDVAPLAASGSTVVVTPDLDEDTDPASVVLLDAAGNPVRTLDVPGEGTWVVNPDGTVTFTPVAGFTADPTPVRYTAADAAGNLAIPATMTVNYPQAPATTALAAPGAPAVFTPTFGDGIDPTSLRIVDPATGARVTELVVPGEGTWTVGDDGKLTFTPLPGFTDDPTPIEYVVSDTAGNESPPGIATVNYPQVSTATASADQGQPATFRPVFDDGVDPATAVIIDPATGQGVKQLVVPGEGTWVVNPDGSVTFTPEAGFQGSPTPVMFTAADAAGNLAPPQPLTVTYPDVPDVEFSATPGQAFTVPLSLADNMDPTTVSLLDANGNRVKSLTVPGEGTWTVDPTTGALTFTPQAGFDGVPSPVQYTAADVNGRWALPATLGVLDNTVTAPTTPPGATNPPSGTTPWLVLRLPSTGTTVPWTLAGLAALALFVGAGMLATRRRREQ